MFIVTETLKESLAPLGATCVLYLVSLLNELINLYEWFYKHFTPNGVNAFVEDLEDTRSGLYHYLNVRTS